MRVISLPILSTFLLVAACAPKIRGGQVLVDGGVAGMIAADDSYLYWTTVDGISRVPLTGGSATTVVSAAQVGAFAVDKTAIYWVSERPEGGASINAMALDGGTPKLLTTTNSLPFDLQFAMGETNVYWVNPVADGGVQLDWVPKAGGAVGAIPIDSRPEALVIDGDKIYSATSWQWPHPGVFVTDLATGSTRQLASEWTDGWSLAINSTDVFWLAPDHNEVHAISKSGGSARTVAAGSRQGSRSLTGLAADDQYVLWGLTGSIDPDPETYRDDGAVSETRIDGSATSSFAEGQTYPGSFLVHQGYLYWVDLGAPMRSVSSGQVLFKKL